MVRARLASLALAAGLVLVSGCSTCFSITPTIGAGHGGVPRCGANGCGVAPVAAGSAPFHDGGLGEGPILDDGPPFLNGGVPGPGFMPPPPHGNGQMPALAPMPRLAPTPQAVPMPYAP